MTLKVCVVLLTLVALSVSAPGHRSKLERCNEVAAKTVKILTCVDLRTEGIVSTCYSQTIALEKSVTLEEHVRQMCMGASKDKQLDQQLRDCIEKESSDYEKTLKALSECSQLRPQASQEEAFDVQDVQTKE